MIQSTSEGYKQLAIAVINLARADLNSAVWKDQDSAIRFFEDEEYLEVVCGLAEIHPSHVLASLPSYELVGPPANLGKVEDLRTQLYDIWRDGELERTVEGRALVEAYTKLSRNTVNGLIASHWPNAKGVAVVRHGEKVQWPSKFDIFRNGRYVKSVYGLRAGASYMNVTISKAQKMVASGATTQLGHQIAHSGEKPAKEAKIPADPRLMLIEVYKDGRLHRVVAGQSAAGRIAGVTASHVSTLLTTGNATSGGWTFRRKE